MSVFINNPNIRAKEGSSFNVTAYFRDGSAASAPSTAQYRVDCLTTGKKLIDWTNLSTSVSNTISITATLNAIQDSGNKTERKQITVQADQDTSTQTRDTSIWDVENNNAF